MQSFFNTEQKKYYSIHEPRFNRVLEIVKNLDPSERSDIMDVGPSILTAMLRENFPKSTITTLGITGEDRDGGHLPGGIIDPARHIEYNLNLASDHKSWPETDAYDLVICAELVEHLYTAPEYLFRFFTSLIKPGGHLLIQTPNAASLIKRLTLLAGRNPYERIRLNSENPGHFREYTQDELIEIATESGFEIKSITVENYFNLLPVTWKVHGYRFLQKLLGKNVHDGITLVCRNGEQ